MSIPISPLESEIVNDVFSKTGIKRARIEGFPTSELTIAEAVLPILAEWVPRLHDRRYRVAIYSRFCTPHANRFLSLIVDWIRNEEHPMAVEILNGALEEAVQPSDAEWIMKVMATLPRSPNYYFLLAKLTTFSQTAADAKEKIVRELGNPKFGFAEWKAFSTVDDPRVFAWFEGQLNSPNTRIRALARRVVDRGKRLPSGVEYIETEPDRIEELFSAEVDLDEAGDLLKKLAADFRLVLPISISDGRFLSRLLLDRWTATVVKTRSGQSARIYFRLEEVDVVEIVLSRAGREATAQ